MSYIYLAKYNAVNDKFLFKNTKSVIFNIHSLLANTLQAYNNYMDIGEESNISNKDEIIYFYIAYHPTSLFLQIIDQPSFLQYIYENKTENNIKTKLNNADFFIYPNFDKESDVLVDILKELNIQYGIEEGKLPCLPIIHLSDLDLFTSNEQNDLLNIPRYIKILDNSIWNYYVPSICTHFNSENDELSEKTYIVNNYNLYESLKRVISYIHYNQSHGLHSLKICQEYADFHGRLARESYLSKDAHGSDVVPFLFHSESEMKQRVIREILRVDADYRLSNFKKQRLTSLSVTRDMGMVLFNPKKKPLLFNFKENSHPSSKAKWRFLLLDDFANIPLRGHEDYDDSRKITTDKLVEGGKLKIIIDNIIPYFDIDWCIPTFVEKEYGLKITFESVKMNSMKEECCDISIFCAHTINEAIALLQEFRFDIILLDYLLGKSTKKNGRDYSYTLLTKLKEMYSQGKIDAGPNGKFSIMHISAFTTAISERLQEQGLLSREKVWEISKGACPTNTPQLFTYYLLRFMERQYRSIVSLSGNMDENIITLIDLLSCIFQGENPRERANTYFNSVLEMRRKYDILKNDIRKEDSEIIKDKGIFCAKGSVLVHSLFDDIENYSNSFWEHLIHLVYLTAYGTVRQWAEMWEEYIFVKPKLMTNATNIESKPAKLCEAIERYIISLKNNS